MRRRCNRVKGTKPVDLPGHTVDQVRTVIMNIQNGLPYGGGATMAAPRRKPNSSLKTGVGCYRAIKLSCVAMSECGLFCGSKATQRLAGAHHQGMNAVRRQQGELDHPRRELPLSGLWFSPPAEERRRTLLPYSAPLAWERRHERHHLAPPHC